MYCVFLKKHPILPSGEIPQKERGLKKRTICLLLNGTFQFLGQRKGKFPLISLPVWC